MCWAHPLQKLFPCKGKYIKYYPTIHGETSTRDRRLSSRGFPTTLQKLLWISQLYINWLLSPFLSSGIRAPAALSWEQYPRNVQLDDPLHHCDDSPLPRQRELPSKFLRICECCRDFGQKCIDILGLKMCSCQHGNFHGIYWNPFQNLFFFSVLLFIYQIPLGSLRDLEWIARIL